MARILYGVMGDAGGHVNRGRIVATEMRGHEFLFVGGGRVLELREEGYQVQEVPIPGTYYRGNRVDAVATAANALKVFLGAPRVIGQLVGIIEDFDPDLIVTDYEFFTPRAARRVGRPCVSLDHQHILTHCRYPPPSGQRMSGIMTTEIVRRLYSSASFYLITSFFSLPPTDPESVRVLPPLLRRSVLEQTGVEGDHVLVYQTSPTFLRLFPVLEAMGGRYLIYGFGERPSRGGLIFKGPSRTGFLSDLASCRYVITNGGHNVISEALFLGKPVLSFPIGNAYEQFFNAYFLDRMGYGTYSLSRAPSPDIFFTFESRLDQFRRRILKQTFLGNEEVRSLLERLIRV